MRAIFVISMGFFLFFSGLSWAGDNNLPAEEDIQLPVNYKDWAVISATHRTDHKSIRIIVGNDIAIKAARSGQTNPWPDGSVIGKMV
jgi:hypothetical protein